ncbi:MAG TPA: hypothetical protein VJ765_04480 [Chitinophagaceae bacterium]|nr:hypothetical protein [Chitinophagaceae bacterium]
MRATVHRVRALMTAFILVLSLWSNSQSISFKDGKFEVGLGLGPAFFLGDLGGGTGIGKPFIKDLDLPLTKFSKGLYVNIYPAEWLGFRLAFNHSHLEGSDDEVNLQGGREFSRWRRNLYFQSDITELYFGIELYPTVWLEQYDGLLGKFRPYGITGVGGFRFNPKAYYYPDPNNMNVKELVELRPLRLEGQGMSQYPESKEYNLTQLEIPMGAGFKFYIKENTYIGLEVLHRKTFTDYIDDVSTKYIDPIYFSQYLAPADVPIAYQLHNREPFRNITRPTIGKQRGDPKEMDSYFSFMLRFGLRLNGNSSPNKRALRQLRCPLYY